MHTTNLRQVGGSIMLAVLPALLDVLHLTAGAKVGLAVDNGRLVVEPKARPRYTMDELLAASSGVMPPWEFELDGEKVRIDPTGPLVVTAGGASDFTVDAAVAGLGILGLFEEWLRPHFERGTLEPVLEPWWERFSGPFLYYPGRRLVPTPLRAFIDFIKASSAGT